MSQKISNTDAEQIKSILDGWPLDNKLTWGSLVSAISYRMKGNSWSRVSLSSHKDIYDAYKLRKKAQKMHTSTQYKKEAFTDISEEGRIAGQVVERLEAEIERLKIEVSRWQERYVTITYNAHSYNLTDEMLQAPLPSVDRVASRK